MRPKGGRLKVREHELSIYKRLSSRWRELTEPFEGTELLTVWLDELDRRLNVDLCLKVDLTDEGTRSEALRIAWRVLHAALKEAGAEGAGEVKELALRLHAPVYGTVPEEAGLFDAMASKVKRLGPSPEGKPSGEWFEKIWWHPWLLRLSGVMTKKRGSSPGAG